MKFSSANNERTRARSPNPRSSDPEWFYRRDTTCTCTCHKSCRCTFARKQQERNRKETTTGQQQSPTRWSRCNAGHDVRVALLKEIEKNGHFTRQSSAL